MVYWVFQCFVIVKFMTNYDDFSNAMKQIHQKISEKNVKQNCSILGAKEVPNHLIIFCTNFQFIVISDISLKLMMLF